jgi:hypothetical protein
MPSEIQINAPIYLRSFPQNGSPDYEYVDPPKTSRNFDTIYYNSMPAPRFVNVCVGVNRVDTQGGAMAYICEDAQVENPVWIRVAMEHCSWQSAHKARLWGTVVFNVPPGWYYKVEKVYADLHLYDWVETDIYAIYS